MQQLTKAIGIDKFGILLYLHLNSTRVMFMNIVFPHTQKKTLTLKTLKSISIDISAKSMVDIFTIGLNCSHGMYQKQYLGYRHVYPYDHCLSFTLVIRE